MEKHKTECVVCCQETEVLDKFNGEMMCQECYKDPDNYVFVETEAELKIQPDAIVSTVRESNGVFSSINQTAEQILIYGGRIT